MSKFIIEIRTKGFGDAKKSMDDLTKSSKGFKDEADRVRGRTKGLIGSLGSLRNQLLVYTFAIGGAVAAMNKFVKAASGFEDVKTRLVGLTGSVEGAEKAFAAFNAVAATTPFQLDDVVNAGAQLEAFGVDAEATLQATTDLAAFMGTSAVEAASSLGRAFAGGAGAADILRERGILQLIKDSEGIKDLTKLTLPEFRVALIRAMADPDGRISGSADRMSETFTGAVSNMFDAITRFNAKVGNELMPALKSMVNATEDFFRTLEIDDLKRWGLELATVGTAYYAAGIAANFATGATIRWAAATATLVKWFRRLGIGLMIAAFDHYVQLVLQGSIYMDGWIPKVKTLRLQKEKLADTYEGSGNAVQEYIRKLEVEQMVTAQVNDETMKQIEAKSKRIESLMIEAATMETTNVVTKAYIEAKIRGNEISEIELTLLQQIQDQKEKIVSAAEQEKIAEQQLKEQMEAATRAIEDRITAMQSLQNEMQSMIITNQEFMFAQITGSEKMGQLEALRLNTINDMSKAFDVLSDGQGKSFNQMMEGATIQELLTMDMEQFNIIAAGSGAVLEQYQLAAGAAADAILDFSKKQEQATDKNRLAASAILSVASAMRQLSSDTMTAEQRLSLMLSTAGSLLMMNPATVVPGAVMSAASMFFGHTGGLVKENGIQRFAQGGMVRGQDNVPIMAQSGEFIMQRNAVQNIGVQNLAQMNQSGQGGGVTVNIQGNMIGNDEFVRDNLIPQIQKAAKQNLA